MNIRFDMSRSREPHVDDLTGRALGLWGAARCRAERMGEVLSEFSARKPAAALGLALGMGALVGWLVKRR